MLKIWKTKIKDCNLIESTVYYDVYHSTYYKYVHLSVTLLLLHQLADFNYIISLYVLLCSTAEECTTRRGNYINIMFASIQERGLL